MTVYDLIQALAAYPSETEVRIDTGYGPESRPVVVHGLGQGYESHRLLLFVGDTE